MKLTIAFLLLTFWCSAQSPKEPDSVVMLTEATQKRILALQEIQKQAQQEIDYSLKTAIEIKGLPLDKVLWQFTTLDLPNRKIFVKLNLPKNAVPTKPK